MHNGASTTTDCFQELFGAIGAFKKARLLRVGVSEVVFVRKEDAMQAVRKYNMRELDGEYMEAFCIIL